MKRILLTKEAGRTQMGQGLIEVKKFDEKNDPPMFVTLSVYEMDKEQTTVKTLSLGDEIIISGITYKVSSIEIRKTRDKRSLSERLLLELETP